MTFLHSAEAYALRDDKSNDDITEEVNAVSINKKNIEYHSKRKDYLNRQLNDDTGINLTVNSKRQYKSRAPKRWLNKRTCEVETGIITA